MTLEESNVMTLNFAKTRQPPPPVEENSCAAAPTGKTGMNCVNIESDKIHLV